MNWRWRRCRGPGRSLAHGRARRAVAADRARRVVQRRRLRRPDRARDPASAHTAGRRDRRQVGLAGAALQGLLRNPLAEPALFGAPQAAAATASAVIAFGLVGHLVCRAVRRHRRRADLDRRPGRHLRPAREPDRDIARRPCAGELRRRRHGARSQSRSQSLYALEVAFWLLGSLEDRSIDHLIIAGPFFVASWITAGDEAARVSRAHARRGCRRFARRRHRPHAADSW